MRSLSKAWPEISNCQLSLGDSTCRNRPGRRSNPSTPPPPLAATRNRMRHRVVPWLEKEFGRGIRKAIWRAASVAAEEDALLDSLLPTERGGHETLSVAVLRAQPIALQRRALRRWLRARAVAD